MKSRKKQIKSSVKQMLIELLGKLKDFPPTAKKNLTESLSRNTVKIDGKTRQERDDIYVFLGKLFTDNPDMMRKSGNKGNKQELLRFEKKLEQKPAKTAEEKLSNIQPKIKK